MFNLRKLVFYHASYNQNLIHLCKKSIVSIYPHLVIQDKMLVNDKRWKAEDLDKDYHLEPGIKFKKDKKITSIPYLYRGFVDHSKVIKGKNYPYFFSLKSHEKIELLNIIDTFELMRISEDIQKEKFHRE